MNSKEKTYKPGFFCALFWVISWLGMLTGIGSLFFSLETAQSVSLWAWSAAAVSAVISYIIRTCEKNAFEGRKTWRWFD